MLTRRAATASLVSLAAIVLFLAIAFRALGGVEFSASLDVGVQPGRSTADIEARVVSQLDMMADAAGKPRGGSAEAIATTLDRLDRFLADAPELSEAGWGYKSVVWLVRAHGTFVTFRGRSTEPRTADSGWFILDDATGEIIAMGFPLKLP